MNHILITKSLKSRRGAHDFYSSDLRIMLVGFLRAEERFASPSELLTRIDADISWVCEYCRLMDCEASAKISHRYGQNNFQLNTNELARFFCNWHIDSIFIDKKKHRHNPLLQPIDLQLYPNVVSLEELKQNYNIFFTRTKMYGLDEDRGEKPERKIKVKREPQWKRFNKPKRKIYNF